MVGVRSALALGVVLSVLYCPTLGSHISKTSRIPNNGLTACQSASWMVRMLTSERHRPSDVSQFRQFRYRMKSVLGETTDPTAEESDLGPAVIPGRLSSVSLFDLTSRRHPTVHPLRC
jgi:hypothetical protein